MAQIFSRDPVWSQTTKSGFRQQVFIMYHSTDPYSVRDILENGFKISQRVDLTLSDGLYVTRDIKKTLNYGAICFKLLVYPGKSVMITEQDDPLRTTWHQEYSSAWVPANRYDGFNFKNKEETCVKSSSQVRILGIAYGHELLDYDLQRKLPNLFGTGRDSLNRDENDALDRMLEDLGIIYSSFVHEGSSLFLECCKTRPIVRLNDWTGKDEQLWARTWDNCLENKANGMVLVPGNDRSLLDSAVMVEPLNLDTFSNKHQKWKLDNRGRFLHKISNSVLTVNIPTYPPRPQDQLNLLPYHFGKYDFWRFRCMGSTRSTDSFVQFTPWQEILSWD